MAYTPPGTNPIQDKDRNDAAGFGDRLVMNQTPDKIAPMFVTAMVNGKTLTLTYSEGLDEDSVPAPSAFTVKAYSREVEVSNPVAVAISGAVVTLTLKSVVTSGQIVTVS